MTQAERILSALIEARPGYICALRWVREVPAILRYSARVWDLRHAGHEIEERICEHGVAEYRLVRLASENVEQMVLV